MKEQRRLLIAKALLYTLLVLITLLAQCTLPMPGVWRVHPPMLITLTALIAFFEGPRAGGIFGAVCGILCDWLSVHTVSYYLVTLMLFGVALGLFIEYSMRRSMLSAFFVSVVTLVPTQVVFFTLFLLLPGRASPYALVTVTTPEILYALALMPLQYLPAGIIHRRLSHVKGRAAAPRI